MQGHAKHRGDRSTATVQGLGAAPLAAALIALTTLSVLVAGCGGNSPAGGVASLGSHASNKSTTNPAAAGSGAGSASPGSQAVAYSSCMRAHGVPNFPDPKVSTNGNEVKVAIGVNPSITGNPQFKSAQQACGKLLPGGGPGSGPNHQISPREEEQYLKAAACIRSHGIPNFPDPTFSGGGVHIDHQDLNESSPTFKAAVHACESLIPGGVHGGSGSSREAAR